MRRPLGKNFNNLYPHSAAKLRKANMQEDQRTQRIEKQSIRVIKVPSIPANANAENYYFPINLEQVKELEEAIHTRIEMLNLTKKSEDAAKVVFNELLWQWFADIQENSTTSYEGCIAPVIVDNHKDSEFYPSNRWGYQSEEEFEQKQPKTNPFVLQD